jgi:hypothetical protein
MALAAVARILRETGLKSPLETHYVLSWYATVDMINVRRAIITHGDVDIIEPRDRWTISCPDTGFIDDNVHYQPLKLHQLSKSMLKLKSYKLGEVYPAVCPEQHNFPDHTAEMDTVALKDIIKAILFHADRLEKEAAKGEGL